MLRIGFRPVATAGMALMSFGALLLTQVSVGGSYFGDVFFGLLVFGPGVGLAFVTASIAALAGVDDHEAGLASGLSNTSFQIGAALGVAIVATVSRHAHEATSSPPTRTQSKLLGLTEGFQSAFLACGLIAAAGAVIALALLGNQQPGTAIAPAELPSSS